MKDNISENLKKGVNYTVKSIKRKITETIFLTKATMMHIKEKNKLFYGIIDEQTQNLYLRASKERFFKENISLNCVIQNDEKTKQYKVIQYDYETKVDYLIKINDKYQTVKCIKIKLENVAS